MAENDNQNIVFIIIILIIAYVGYMSFIKCDNKPSSKRENFNNLEYIDSNSSYDSNNSNDSNDSNDLNDTSNLMNIDPKSDVDNYSSNSMNYSDNSSNSSSIEIIKRRAKGQNHGRGKYSYRTLSTPITDDVNEQFKVNNVEDNKGYSKPMLYSEDTQAPVNFKNNKGTEKDKFDVKGFLPQEKMEDQDWFETIETVDVKNKHLINIYRPCGVNTMGGSHRNMSHDIRGNGSAICPKTVVSPWSQSSIEPDMQFNKNEFECQKPEDY
jgi:hypothetical protein